MYTIKRYFVFLLCLCMSSYSLPAFAYISNTDDKKSEKVELTDQAMEEIQGAGSLDATMVDYKVGGQIASAILVNRHSNATYSLEVVDKYGQVLEVLDSGMTVYGETKIVSGKPTGLGTTNRKIRIRLESTSFAGFKAIDTSFATTSIDSDKDGITDWSEKLYGLDPYNPNDAVLDKDGDTLSNIDEINIHRTDPTKIDTDGDGLADNIELANNLNPLNPIDATLDADSDYVTNIEEILVYKTNPYVADPGLAPDTDNDGIKDTVEIAIGTDPNDPLSNDVGLNDHANKHIAHVLNRVSFGPTPELISGIKSSGGTVDDWVNTQLSAVDFKNDPTQAIRQSSYITSNYVGRLGAIRPVHSTNQLQARMGLFWDNHFSTSVTETRWDSELHEEDVFFTNAFGNFKTLLTLSAKGDAMLRYLDLIRSTAAGANENYSREVMELHTLGTTITDGDYDGQDIAELARIFTGWYSRHDIDEPSIYKTYVGGIEGLRDSRLYRFEFLAYRHDATEKTFMNTVFPAGGGVDEGEKALDMLARHPSTAKFICLKIARHFISDEPKAKTLSDCATTFTTQIDAPNQIELVLRNLFASAEFRVPATYRTKFKDHQEYVFSMARLLNWSAVGVVPTDTSIIPYGVVGDIYRAMGQRQFAKAEPTGWAEDVAGGWVSADSALQRFRQGNIMSLKNTSKLAAEFKALGIASSKDVLANLYLIMLGGNYDAELLDMGYRYLHPNNSKFDLNTMSLYTADVRIRNLIARLAQLPEFSAH